jgi:hypothetical protein
MIQLRKVKEREDFIMKEFFSITADKYIFEVWDVTTLLTILNVALVLCGWHFAPLIGIGNCLLCLGLNVKNRSHINNYVIQIALIVLNSYFLTL